MQTNPEQWARDLMCDLPGEHWDSEGIDTGALTIQAAFAEREARLVWALEAARQIITEIDDYMKRPERGDWGVECACCMGKLLDDDRDAIARIDITLAALKDRTDG